MDRFAAGHGRQSGRPGYKLVDTPGEDLIVIFLTQFRPSASYPIRRQPRATVYGAIID